jgi:hypothetical protein
LEYIEWAKQVVAGLRGTSVWLEQFDEAADQAERSMFAATYEHLKIPKM